MAAIAQSSTLVPKGLAYFPMTLGDEVRYTWRQMVRGSWMLSIIWETISALNALLTRSRSRYAPTSEIKMPIREWLSCTS